MLFHIMPQFKERNHNVKQGLTVQYCSIYPNPSRLTVSIRHLQYILMSLDSIRIKDVRQKYNVMVSNNTTQKLKSLYSL